MKNTRTNRNPWKNRRTGIDITTPVHSGISKTSTPAPSDNIVTKINGINGASTPTSSGISGTSSEPPAGGLWSPIISSIRKSAYPNHSDSNGLNADIDGKFSSNPIAPPILTQVFIDKLSDIYSKNLYVRCRLHLMIDKANTMEP